VGAVFRLVVVLVAAGLLAVQVVRNAAVAMLATTKPTEASQLWSEHPATELSLAMTQIAQASRARRQVPPSAFAMIGDAAVKEPLAPEPFLVRGVRAELAGDGANAQRAFEAAQWRDPRSLPAAYFLADRYLKHGDLRRGLGEAAALSRLATGGATNMAPFIAVYAQDRANWPELRNWLLVNPELAESTLTALAHNAATVPAVLALADPREKARDAQWLAPLLVTLTSAGQYGEAKAIWQRMTRTQSTGLLYDAGFRDKASPPPFNWALTSSSVGLAERQAGKLHVLFFGTEDGILASQMVLLQPGEYRLSLQLGGDQARAKTLNWSIWCDKGEGPIASVRLDIAASAGWTFTIPAGCPAQWFKLSAVSGDIPQQVDVSIAALRLERLTRA
jgi:hypothetical protein